MVKLITLVPNFSCLRPCARTLELSSAVEIAISFGVAIRLCKSCLSNSFSSSRTAFSATGFLFLFFIWPISTTSWYLCKIWSSWRAANPGPASHLTTAGGPSRGWQSASRRMRASLRLWCRSFSSKLVRVYELTHSLTTRISWRSRLSTSAANAVPKASGGDHK